MLFEPSLRCSQGPFRGFENKKIKKSVTSARFALKINLCFFNLRLQGITAKQNLNRMCQIWQNLYNYSIFFFLQFIKADLKRQLTQIWTFCHHLLTSKFSAVQNNIGHHWLPLDQQITFNIYIYKNVKTIDSTVRLHRAGTQSTDISIAFYLSSFLLLDSLLF